VKTIMARGLRNPNHMAKKGRKKGKGKRQRKNPAPKPRPVPRPVSMKQSQQELIANSGFLKCALGSIDFDTTGFRGVPDSYSGKVFCEHWDLVQSVTVPAGQTSIYMLPPSPGVAYAALQRQEGDGTYEGTYMTHHYPDQTLLFPETSGSYAITSFRLVSNCFEMTNTTPMVNRGGSIQVAELDLKMLPAATGAPYELDDETYYFIEGYPKKPLDSGLYVGGGPDGIYTAAYNRNNKWDWNLPLEYAGLASTPAEKKRSGLFPLDWTDSALPPVLKASINQDSLHGWNNDFATKLIVVQAPADHSQTFVIRTKQCVEFRPRAGSLFERIAGNSPPHNSIELALYAETVKNLPAAVPRKENDNFWSKVKRIAGVAFSALEKTVMIGNLVLPLL